MRKLVVVILIATVVVIVLVFGFKKDGRYTTEDFIERWLRNENGTLATYIKDGDVIDEDLVKGRETLSETLGLWMLYAIEKEDKLLFDEAYEILEQFFLEKDGFIHWKLNELGESDVYTNALVDDLRVIDALFRASDKWDYDAYEQTAFLISDFVNRFNTNKNILTDFYERLHNYSSDYITLSYIDPRAMEEMLSRNTLDVDTYEETLGVLEDAPVENGFYPKSYNVRKQSYVFDKELNMVDQALVAYNQAKSGIGSAEFSQFIKGEFKRNGAVYGKYDIQTKEPTVTYESPAVYGIMIMYCLEIGEKDFANVLYKRMIEFRHNKPNDPYYGGYSVDQTGDTHIFDNLVPLLAERKLYKK